MRQPALSQSTRRVVSPLGRHTLAGLAMVLLAGTVGTVGAGALVAQPEQLGQIDQPGHSDQPAKQPAQQPATTPPPAPAEPAGKPKPSEPTPDQIIKDLERSAPKSDAPRPAAAPSPSATPTPTPAATTAAPTPGQTASAGPGKLLREGTFIAQRRGRMIRAASGDWLFHFDSDTKAEADPAMVLMPCLNLMSMEKLAERGGETLTFQVSGQVFVYRGKNYLLPTMYQVNRRESSPGR
jgi:hypothetical protein